MKVDDALVCLNCDEVYDRESGACPACASDHFHPLNDWLQPWSEERAIAALQEAFAS